MNREAERKRLVELLDNFFKKESGIGFTQKFLGELADNILDDGWMRPPCKVGQILYVIEAGLIFEAKVKEYKYCSNSANGIHWNIIFEELFAMSEAHIGKTAFTSREQAQKALEGSGEK